MGVRFDTTLPSLFAQRQTTRAADRATRGLQQIASGLRIDRASADAAGLAIAERLRASIREANQEAENFQSGINAARTAEGGLESQAGAVGRIRELAVQASNGTLTADQRAALNAEAQQLIQEIDATAQNTEFNGTRPLDGSTGSVALDAHGDVVLEFSESTAESLGVSDIDLSTPEGAASAVSSLDGAANQIGANRARLGAQENRVAAAIEQRAQQAFNEEEAQSRIRDLDTARAAIDQARTSLLARAGIAAIAQGNLQGQNALRLLGG